MLVTAGRDVEQRCLAAVWISDKGHVDRAPLAVEVGMCGRSSISVVVFGYRRMVYCNVVQVGGVYRNHFNQIGFAASERHFITHQGIFDGVTHRCRKQGLDEFASHKTPFQSVACEMPVP